MAATGYTPISLYYSTTASAVPTSGNLANGELALNIADMKLYAKNSAGTVTLLASNASTAAGVDSLSFGSTGLTPSTATTGAITVAGTLNVANGGTGQTSFTANRLLYGNGTGGLNSSAGLTFDGTTLGVTGPLNLAGTSTFPTSGLMLRSADNQLKVVAGSAGISFAAASGASTFGTFDSAGNLALGISPSAWYSGTRTIQLGNGLSLWSTANTNAALSQNLYLDATATYRWITANPATNFSQSNGAFTWQVAAGTPSAGGAIGSFNTYMTLDTSGNLLVGVTSFNYAANGVGLRSNAYSYFTATSNASLLLNRKGTTGSLVSINYEDSGVGSISTDGSSTAYNTSSDYRLKNTIVPMTGALAKVALLKPVTYKWNVNDSDGEGFIAHELAEVCPDAVTGTKDAVDEDGNPVYQGIDTSFLVATLTAAIQEQQAIISAQATVLESLKARLDAANL